VLTEGLDRLGPVEELDPVGKLRGVRVRRSFVRILRLMEIAYFFKVE
jgi:hypothetical protein